HDRSFVWLDYFLPCSNSLLGIATSHIGLIRSLYCSVFKEPSLFKRLGYLTTFREVCQMIFSNYFSSLFRTGPLHQRRLLSYHTVFLVSTVFFEFFYGSGFRVQGCAGSFAAIYIGAMPEGERVAVFPFAISKHWPPDRKWKDFSLALEMTIWGADV
ncbi:MAG: hypothetical protein UDM29_05840, partial [Dialister sp.]|nr:hypothetical protein [Dialister sp.]